MPSTPPHGRLLVTVLGGIGEFERELIRSRISEGRHRARRTSAQGSPYAARGGEAVTDIARSYNVSHSTISRLCRRNRVAGISAVSRSPASYRRCSAAALRGAGVHSNVVSAIRTKALLTAKKIGGAHATNREKRWLVSPDHPQYGTELGCHIIFVKLAAQIFCFDNAPPIPTTLSRVPASVKALGPGLKDLLEHSYAGHEIRPDTFRNSLLLERFDFNDLVAEGLKSGARSFELSHRARRPNTQA